MGKMTISAVVGFLVMWCVVSAFGLGADHPADRPVGGSPEWPVGLVDLVNRDQRVHGFFVNANDFFLFSGGVLGPSPDGLWSGWPTARGVV